MSVSRHHADWLSLLESSGPFLSLPVLLRAFPQGLDPRDPEQARQLRLAYEEWQENPTLTAKQRSWAMHVLTQVLLHPKELLAEGQTLPPGLTATMAEYGEILRPELTLIGPTGSDLTGKPQLLISLYPVEQSLDKPVAGKHWKATPGTRMMELLHATDVPLGLVTNGEQWMSVFAPRGETTGFTSWYASLWVDEPITLRAFHSLLSTRRFFGVAPSDTFLALLKESAQDQQEVTNQLGDQVRDAVEVLIQAFDRLDQDSGRTLLKGLDERSLYDAALTVMMRLVFLFSAEERGLLHLNEPLYDDNYAVSTLREQLQEVADRYGEEVLERRHDGWARLLAAFRAVHGGVNHQDLMLPAYGGSLFDPDRYPFLEGRAQGSRWQSSPAAPLEINNRVVLHLLKSLQMLQVKVPGGGPAEALRVSFEGLNIEQIGHVYEGLLDHTAVRAKEVVLGLAASRKKPVASIALAELEKLRQDDEAKLIEVLEEETGRSARALENALNNGDEPEDFHKLLVACGQDKGLVERIIPFQGLLRQDTFERLVVVLPGGIYVGQGSARRSTGTHYTPRSLTEPIVQHTLEPLVYEGPAEGLAKEQWRLRSPKEILDLKVCDMAMGSGAFLVQVCRYLSERLVEAWENLEREHPGEVLITPEGGFSRGEPTERLIPKEPVERLAIARRLVADRCLYGVDINPMAVEMAKLSIWLITVDKSRPFTFLDHALKCGDSLLGVNSLRQIENFSSRPNEAQITFSTANLFRYVEESSAKRLALEAMPSDRSDHIEAKNRLHSDAEAATAKLEVLADCLMGLELRGLEGKLYEEERTAVAESVEVAMQQTLEEFQSYAQTLLSRRTFHWPLQFPEVFERGGFDALVGNPPFLWGSRISSTHGDEYLAWLLSSHPGSLGTADLCCYFLRRAYEIVRPRGFMGLIATNSIKQTDSRISCLDHLIASGASIVRAEPDTAWPGGVALQIAIIFFYKGDYKGNRFLAGIRTERISSFLDASGHRDKPESLRSQEEIAFKGVDTGGLGFVITAEEEEKIKCDEPESLERIWTFLNGQEFLSHPYQQGCRRIINFSGLSEQEARAYPSLIKIVEERVLPHRETVKRDENKNKWWLYNWPRPVLYRKISSMRRVLVNCVVSKFICFEFMNPRIVFSNALNIFALDTFTAFAVLQSTLHEQWARYYGSTLETRNRYNPTDCFETFPWVTSTEGLETAGAAYHNHRSTIMSSRLEGLTDTYNRFHTPSERSEDIARLRTLHVEMDQTVAVAYGWNDLDLGHAFYETKQGVRFTISEPARRLVLDRLVTLNHESREKEIRGGLRDKVTKASQSGRRSGKNKIDGDSIQGGLPLRP